MGGPYPVTRRAGDLLREDAAGLAAMTRAGRVGLVMGGTGMRRITSDRTLGHRTEHWEDP